VAPGPSRSVVMAQVCRRPGVTGTPLPADVTRWLFSQGRYRPLTPKVAPPGQNGREYDHTQTEFLQLADAHDAEVSLHCDPSLVKYYRRHGFRVIDASQATPQVMLRQAFSRNRQAPPLVNWPWPEGRT
jgi:hypothetical protein